MASKDKSAAPLGAAGDCDQRLCGARGGGAAGGKNNGDLREETGGFFGNRFQDGGLSGVIGILGQTGTGKTYAAKRMMANARRVIFFQTVRQRPEDDLYPSGFRLVSGLGNLVKVLGSHRVGKGSFKIVYRPERGAYEVPAGKTKVEKVPRYRYDLRAICKLLMEVQNTVLVVDEVWKHCTPGWMPEEIDDVTLTGRHFGVTFVYTAQRPQLVCKDLIAITQQFRIFRIQHPGDLDALRGHVPDPALEQVKMLPDHVHVARDERHNWRISRL